MAAIKSEMPPLHAAEALGNAGAGGGGGGGGVGGVGNGNGSSTDTATGSNINITTTANNSSCNTSTTTTNATISAAADSSDNQPATPQPPTPHHQQQQQMVPSAEQQQAAAATNLLHQPYNMYSGSAASSGATAALPHMYGSGIYSQEMQQQAVSQQQPQQYGSYLHSYEQFYQQQAQTQLPQEYAAGTLYSNSGGTSDFKSNHSTVRYHPYLQAPTSGVPSANTAGNSGDEGNHNALNTSVSTSTAMSPRVVSSSSPTSTTSHIGHLGSNSPPGCKLQCKKCGLMCVSESELQEHITSIHGASPYGSSGYSSSPYIKEELSAGASGAPPTATQAGAGGNPGDILDLDSQKMVYPPTVPPASMQSLLQPPHQQLNDSDPLHSMHSMQQRALPSWPQQETMPTAYMQSQSQPQQQELSGKSPYYSPKQSPYHSASGGGGGVGGIKQEYPLIKSEYADSQQQQYLDKSFDPTGAGGDMCQQPMAQQSQMLPVSSSPAEFPSTTTGPQEQTAQQQQQYRGFEPPSSSSALPANSITAKAATWKSNEARRPKTYNCTACNKWFTSSGHLKRHYNTTLHKNAVKSSGQPDPATLPISAHHHPTREGGSAKHSRRNNAAAAAAAAAQQQQQPPAAVPPPEPPRSPPDYGTNQGAGLGQLSQYSASPSPTQQQSNGLATAYPQQQQQQQNGYQQQYVHQPQQQQVQSTTHNPSNAPTSQTAALNGHPNGLAGPSAPATTPSSHTRGLLNTTITTVTTKTEPLEEDNRNHNSTANSPMDMEMVAILQQQQQQQQLVEEAVAVLQQPLHPQAMEGEEEEEEGAVYQQLESPNSSTRAPSVPLIICHQQLYPEQQQQSTPMVGDNIFSPQPAAHMQLPDNTMEQQQYSIMPLSAISTPPPLPSNSMSLLPPLQHTITNNSTDIMGTAMGHNHSLTMLPSYHQLQEEQQQEVKELLPPMPNTLLSSTSIPQDTINTTHNTMPTTAQQLQLPPLQPPQLTTSTTTIPCFQQLQQASGLLAPPLEPTMSYPTIIGSSSSNATGSTTNVLSPDLLQLTTYDCYGQQMLTTDGQILQFITPTGQPLFTLPNRAAVAEAYAPLSPYAAHRSPLEADLPPAHTLMPHETQLSSTQHEQHESSQSLTMLPSMPAYSPTVSSSTTLSELHEYDRKNDAGTKEELFCPIENLSASIGAAAPMDMSSLSAAVKRTNNKRNSSATGALPKRKRSSVSTSGGSGGSVSPTITSTAATNTLPNGRISCLECNKEFTKICYLTQHNKSFHSGEYPYRCQKCGKRFQSEDVYETHLGRHKAQDKPHKCELCPKQFHHKTDLRRHIEAIHTGQKQHVCDVCEKSFCRKDHLRKHIETHNRPRVVGKRSLLLPKRAVGSESCALGSDGHNPTQELSTDMTLNMNGLGVQQPVSPADRGDLRIMTEHVILLPSQDQVMCEDGALLEDQDQERFIKEEYHIIEQEVPIY